MYSQNLYKKYINFISYYIFGYIKVSINLKYELDSYCHIIYTQTYKV